MYRAKLAKGNYREVGKVVSKVKAILKGVSTYFKCTYTAERGRITIDFDRRNNKIADAERLDGKHALMSTRIAMSAEYALKQLGKVKYVVVTNPDGGITTSKLSIPSREQRQIMDVLGVEYIKSET